MSQPSTSAPSSPAPTLIGGSTPVSTPDTLPRHRANLEASPEASPKKPLSQKNRVFPEPACKRKLDF